MHNNKIQGLEWSSSGMGLTYRGMFRHFVNKDFRFNYKVTAAKEKVVELS